jgi:glutamate/tyrosine decarboxylase-like PLP-dependent enzyme
MLSIPDSGRSKDDIFATLRSYRSDDLAAKGGKVWAYVFDSGRPEVAEIGEQAYTALLHENGLDPTVFPSLLRLENDVVAMALSHLNGPAGSCGTFTSGGTESIVLAVKAARDWGKATKGVKSPNIVLPTTGHAAFHKACHYLGVEARTVPVDTTSWTADVEAMADACDDQTVMLVGSAVSYAHGVTDPIAEIAQVAAERGVLCHVDGCIGGFVLPYFRRLGAQVTDFDFTVPGVTSMSMDFHKYGFAPKGASVVLYRDAEVRKHQFFACADWTGYTIINTAFQSSKSGGPVAACWAVLNHVGDDGYLDIFDRTLRATRGIVEGIGHIDGLEVMGNPESSLVAVTSGDVNVFRLADRMRLKGWYIQPQLSMAGSRHNVHFSVGPSSLDHVPEMLADLAFETDAVRGEGPPRPDAELGALLSSIDPSSLDKATFDLLLAGAGMGDEVGRLPDQTADINALLDQAPPALTEAVLIEYFSRIFMPTGT